MFTRSFHTTKTKEIKMQQYIRFAFVFLASALVAQLAGIGMQAVGTTSVLSADESASTWGAASGCGYSYRDGFGCLLPNCTNEANYDLDEDPNGEDKLQNRNCFYGGNVNNTCGPVNVVIACD